MSCPVALFAYKRPQHLRQVVESLRLNHGAEDTELFIYCDAAARPSDEPGVDQVRAYAKSLSTGFKSVTIIERETNFGLSRSITDGVGRLCRQYGRVAVVEDDVLVSQYFLSWVNAALDKYQHDERVLSVGCYVFPTQEKLPETFFLSLPDCWGWAVWDRSWQLYQGDGNYLLQALADKGLEHRFDFEGAYPYTEMLRGQTLGKNDSWAVRWSASVLLAGGLTVYPGSSMTRNIGFDGSGTHCGVGSAYESELAERLIVLGDIPVAESESARSVWRNFFLSARPSKETVGLLPRIKSRLRRALAW
jgi:hypothetical protein